MKKILLISSLFLLAGCASGTTISNENTTPNKGVIEVDQKEVDLKDIPIFGGTKERKRQTNSVQDFISPTRSIAHQGFE